jgi:succinate dehydrogenase / fumarate reductase cytochrome b subunit
VKKKRPVNLDLSTIKFPPSAISSILHRVTGVAMFFALLFVIWAWAISLMSIEGFNTVKVMLDGIWGKIIAIGTISALSYHIIGGIRHGIMDMGYWEELNSGNSSAKVAMGLWGAFTVMLGVALW